MAIDGGQIVSLWRMNTAEGNAIDSYGNNDLTIVGASIVSGLIEQGLSLDGIDDYAYADSLIADIALDTQGTFYGQLNTDTLGSDSFLIRLANLSSANDTGLLVQITSFGTDWRITATLKIDDVNQWVYRVTEPKASVTGFMQWDLSHDGVEPVIHINGAVGASPIFLISTDKTKWMKSIITDATFKTNSFTLGANRQFGGIFKHVNAVMDIDGYSHQAFGVTEAAEFYNGGAGTELPITSLTVGTATAIDSGAQDINVSMPYTDDDNADSTYTVDYKLSSDALYTNWVTGASNTPSPFLTTITGLKNGGLYDVKVTYIDPDGVVGTNPQVISVQLNMLPDSSESKMIQSLKIGKFTQSSKINKII
jgi:hypothetical protein